MSSSWSNKESLTPVRPILVLTDRSDDEANASSDIPDTRAPDDDRQWNFNFN